MEKKYTVKIYDRAGATFKGNYDPIGGYAFNKTINGGVGALSIQLPREFDNYGLSDDVNLLDEIQIWVQDKDSSGTKIYSGYVSAITSYINEDNQGVTLDVLGYTSRLAFTLDWDGTNISMVRNSQTPGELAKDVIDKYRTTVSEERINYATLSSETIAEYTADNEDGYRSLYTGVDLKIGESFAVDVSRVISTAKFRLSKTGSPTGDMVAKIYAHSGTYGTSSIPTGSALATSAVVTAASLTTTSSWVDFAFSGANAITLSASTDYCLALEYTSTSSNSSNYVKVGLDATSPIYSGNTFIGTWSVLPEKKLSTASEAGSYTVGITMSADGTKVYASKFSGTTKIYQYTLGTAYDLSTASYASKSLDVSAKTLNPFSITFKSDGTKIYVGGATYSGGIYTSYVYQYALSTAWDISTASYEKFIGVSPQETRIRGLFLKSDGTKMYVVGTTSGTIYQYALSTAWDVSTASYENKSFGISSQDNYSTGIYFESSGTKVYILGDTSNRIYQYSLSVAWDISTASYDAKMFSVGTQTTSPKGIFIKSDGTKVYVGNLYNSVYQYALSSAWDISTASYESNDLIFNVNSTETSIDYSGTDISYTSNAKSCTETIDRAREMAGATWYWYVNADNIFYFKPYSTTPTHLFVFGKDISNMEIMRSADDIKNEFIFWNGLQADDTNFLSTRYYNTDSINSYWNRFENLTDGRVVDDTSADQLASAYIGAYKNPNVSMKFEVKDNNYGNGYDIESIEPGHTCKVLNLEDSSVVGSNMVITSVQYTPEKAIVYVSDLREITGRSLTNLRRKLDTTVYSDRPVNITSSAVT